MSNLRFLFPFFDLTPPGVHYSSYYHLYGKDLLSSSLLSQDVSDDTVTSVYLPPVNEDARQHSSILRIIQHDSNILQVLVTIFCYRQSKKIRDQFPEPRSPSIPLYSEFFLVRGVGAFKGFRPDVTANCPLVSEPGLSYKDIPFIAPFAIKQTLEALKLRNQFTTLGYSTVFDKFPYQPEFPLTGKAIHRYDLNGTQSLTYDCNAESIEDFVLSQLGYEIPLNSFRKSVGPLNEFVVFPEPRTELSHEALIVVASTSCPAGWECTPFGCIPPSG